jgi:hypothetical protein
MVQPSQSRPTPPKKSKAKTARAKTVTTKTMKEPKKAGRIPDDDICFDHFGGMCKYKAVHGTTTVPRTNDDISYVGALHQEEQDL